MFLVDSDLKLLHHLQVKVVCQFKGREMDFKDLAFKLFQRFIDDIGEVNTYRSSSYVVHTCYL